MKVYIVMCEEWNGYDHSTSVEEVFLNEESAEAYVKEMNEKFSWFRHYLVEREVKD